MLILHRTFFFGRNCQIDGIGTHDELMKSNEIYREVYASQMKGVE